MAIETGVLPARYAGARRIGHGGMGEIYLAEDRELGRKVAIKILDDRFANDENLHRRFRREALTAARLSSHPHVVTIYDVGEWADRPFIVMEYLPGGTLADRARSGPVNRDQALLWLEQAAAALDAAHKFGIVHRDVKPANLLFDARGEIAVGDFGIARAVDDNTGMTAAGTVLGTAGYLAPEQALGQAATPASDRYALGVVAYELLTGGRPFKRGSTTAEVTAHIHESVPPASERGVGLPRAVDHVFERALAKDPRERYPSAAAFVDHLRDKLATTPATRALPTPPPAQTAEPVAPAPRRSGRQTPWLAFLLAGLILAPIGGALAAILATGGGDSPGATVARAERATVTKEVVRKTPADTVTQTVVTTVSSPPPTSTASVPPVVGAVSIEEAVALTDQSTYALRRGDWSNAANLARRAYRPLSGTYADGFRYEAYVNYDLGKALAELGRCGPALRFLDRSEDLQGFRSEIDEARARCGR